MTKKKSITFIFLFFSNLTQLLRQRADRSITRFHLKRFEPNMYPKVKVKNEADNYKQKSFCPNSNYLRSHASHKKQEDDSQMYVAKIPKFYIPSVLMSETNSTEMNKRVKGAKIEVKQKPKASPILRPRAVVSSPDNDAIIGSINRSEERKTKKGLKSNDQILSRASQRTNVGTNVKISHCRITKQSGVKIPEITKD